MVFSRTSRLILALAFVVGQWFAVVHSTHHELNAADKLVACEVCAIGHAAAPAPVSPGAALVLPHGADSPAAAQGPFAVSVRRVRPPSRAPPFLV